MKRTNLRNEIPNGNRVLFASYTNKLVLVTFLCFMPMLAMADVSIDETNFPDANFRDYVSSQYDKNLDGALDEGEISEAMTMFVFDENVASLTGIEHFSALQILYCTGTQINHYYPFGGLFGESTGNTGLRYKYNGKEFDRTHGLDWYDYGARHMTPDAGRFTTIDPMAEKYYNISPYAYCSNNPIIYLDKNGKWGDKYTTSFIAMMTGTPMSNINYHPNVAGDHRYTITTTGIDSNGGFVVTSHHSFDSELKGMFGNRIESLGNTVSTIGEIIEGTGDVAIGTRLATSLGGAPQVGAFLSAIGISAVRLGSNLQIFGGIMSLAGKGYQDKNMNSSFEQLGKDILFKSIELGTSNLLKHEIPGYGIPESNISAEKIKAAKTLFESGLEKQYDKAIEVMDDEDERK